MLRSMAEGKKNNAGFSLVELIIVVSILAIAAVPLMKSMSMSTKVNAKAQSIQNATSLGESVMEQMKSTPVDKLKTLSDWDVSDDGTTIVMESKSAMQATQGEAFDVTVTIDRGTYSGGLEVLSTTDKKANVSSANTVKLPKIEDIDTLSQAVLTPKELNKYDTEAQSFFNEKKKEYDPESDSSRAATKATIKSKTIEIVKKDVVYPEGLAAKDKPPAVTVTATVTYTDDATPTAHKYIKELYTGSFTALEKDGTTEGETDIHKSLDSNIYIFYKKSDKTDIIPSDLTETIRITDNSNYINPDDPASKDTHRVYYIRQDGLDWVGPKLEINGNTFTYDNVDSLASDGTIELGKTQLVTNLVKGNKSSEGHIYKEEARTRVYEITVKLYKNSELVTTLNSTVNASDKIAPAAPAEP